MTAHRLSPAFHRRVASFGKVVAGLAVVALLLAYAGDADAATHEVGANTSSLDCSTYAGGVRPGDRLVLVGRSRGPIKFNNCEGTASSPIVITNDTSQSGPLVISQSGDGFQTQCTNCEHVVIDGTGKWSGAPAGVCGADLVDGDWRLGTKQCGIVLKCVSGSPHSGLRLSGSSKHVTVKGVEIDANFPTCKKGIGLSVNDHTYTPRAGEWREGIKLLHNYVHGTEGEGIYAGPNQSKSYEGTMQLRNNEIAFNYVDSTGCDAINYKSAIAGSSSIHHNYVTNTGQTARGGDSGCSGSGIALFESGYTEVHSNYVEAPSPVSDGAGHCISSIVSNLSANVVATVPVKIYNNVVRNCKGNGISFGRRDNTVAEPVVSAYNNTVVTPIGGKGVSVGSSIRSCDIRDNIVIGKPLSADQCVVQNNSTDDLESQKFLDPEGRDFRLTANSPAVNVGSSKCPSEDMIGTPRPQHGACDKGAFEFVDGDVTSTKPKPPAGVLVD